MAQSAVLRFLRKRMKVIFWFTAIVFIGLVIFGWGADITGRSRRDLDANIAGKVEDYEITYPMYRNAIQSEYEQAYREERPITEAESEIIADRTWYTLVNRYIAEKQFKAKGFGELTPSEIFESLRRNPPEAVKRLPSFQQDGVFSKELFQQYLGNPQVDWLPVEMLVRNKLPYDKLRQIISATSFVSNGEAISEFEYKNTQADVSFISMDPFSIEDVSIDTSSASLEAYYTKNKEKYRRQETAIVNYAKLPVYPSPSDTMEANAFAESLLVRIQDGEDFAYVAEYFSDDPGSKENGGYLGWITRGQMIPEFEEAVFSADSGELVGPVLTQFGYHLIRVENKEGEEDSLRVDVSHILLTIEPSLDTEDSVTTLARNIVIAVGDSDNFAEYAEAHGVDSMGISIPTIENGPVPGIGYLERAKTMLFKSKEGSIESFAVRFNERPTVEGLTVLQLVKRYSAGIPTFAEIHDEIAADIVKETREQAALELLEMAKGLIDAGKDMPTASKEVGAIYNTTGLFSMNMWVESVGNDPIFKGRVFGLGQQGRISKTFLGQDGKAYIVKIEQFIPANPQDFANLAVSIKNELLWGYRQDIYDRWFTDQRDKAEIVDNRFAEEFAMPSEETE
ncbi:peptidylprolyl isomerase [bacterium]|nr:peptidylprolyl isomerase [bacterium]